jgi:hypothetical protein
VGRYVLDAAAVSGVVPEKGHAGGGHDSAGDGGEDPCELFGGGVFGRDEVVDDGEEEEGGEKDVWAIEVHGGRKGTIIARSISVAQARLADSL